MLRVKEQNIQTNLHVVGSEGGALSFERPALITPASIEVGEGWDDTPRHFTVTGEGVILQHADTHKAVIEKSDTKIRILVLRPDTLTAPWENAVGVSWMRRELVLPTWAQLEALTGLVTALSQHAGVALAFAPIDFTRNRPAQGIHARDPLRADGFAPLAYLQLRLSVGRDLTGAAQGLLWLLSNTKPPAGGGWEALTALAVGALLVAGGAHLATGGKLPPMPWGKK